MPQNDRLQGLEEIVKSLAMSTQQFTASTHNFQIQTEASISELKDQMNKLTTSMNRLESQGRLPSQPEINPRQNVSAIALRSGKEIPSSDATSLQHGHAEATATDPENSKNSELFR